METKNVLMGKIYVLIMNDMRSWKIEHVNPVAASGDYNKLVDWYNSQKCESYKDGNWQKSFEKGSDLEWYNYLYDLDVINSNKITKSGVYSIWMELEDDKPKNLMSTIIWLG